MKSFLDIFFEINIITIVKKIRYPNVINLVDNKYVKPKNSKNFINGQ